MQRDAWRLTITGIKELGSFYLYVFGVLVIIYFLTTGLYNNGLLDPREVVSVFIAEAPLGVGLWWVLGERSRSQFSDAIDSITLGERYEHLTIHYWIVGKWIFSKTFSVVENTTIPLAYDCPPFLEELGSRGIIHRIQHRSEPAMRDYLRDHQVELIEREATFAELRE